MAFYQVLFTRFLTSKPPATLVRKFKANDKITKRDLIGAESVEKERQIAKTIEAKKAEKKRVAAVKAVKKKRIVAEKTIIVTAKIAENKRVKKAQEIVKID